MITLAIHLPTDTYIAPNNQLRDVGDAYIQLGDYYFPEKGWFDFGQNLLSWWLEEFTKLVTGEETKVRCGFMDGAFRFDVQAVNQKQWLICCIREFANDEEVRFKAEVSAVQACESLLQQTQMMIDFLDSRSKGDKAKWLSELKEKLDLAVKKTSVS